MESRFPRAEPRCVADPGTWKTELITNTVAQQAVVNGRGLSMVGKIQPIKSQGSKWKRTDRRGRSHTEDCLHVPP